MKITFFIDYSVLCPSAKIASKPVIHFASKTAMGGLMQSRSQGGGVGGTVRPTRIFAPLCPSKNFKIKTCFCLENEKLHVIVYMTNEKVGHNKVCASMHLW